MRLLTRWAYLVPRLIILGLVGLILWIGSDPIIKYALEQTGEKYTGAKVEIGSIKTSLSQGKVYLKDIKIADAANPMFNLLQAEMAYVELDPQKLLNRNFVIETGTTTKLRFGSPRTESGALPNLENNPRPLANSTVAPRAFHATPPISLDSLSQRWLDQFENQTVQYPDEQLDSLNFANQLQEKWPPRFAQTRNKINQIQSRIAELTKFVNSKDGSNPLRSRRVESALSELEKLQQSIEQFRTELADLQAQASADRKRLVRLRHEDHENAFKEITANQIDSQTVSKLLLLNSQTDYVNEVLHWFRWFEETIPAPDQFTPQAPRGSNVVFENTDRQPTFLIKSIDLEGEGRIAGHHFNFVGTANDLTNQPKLHASPISFHLRAQGKQHLIVDCILDRRKDAACDTLNVHCPAVNVGAHALGRRDSLLVDVSPSRMKAEVSLRREGDRISGEIVFQHSDVLMHVNQVHPLAGGQATANKINLDLASLSEYRTYVQLSGTWERPEFDFRSDLGNKFAAAMNQAADERLLQSTQALRDALKTKLDTAIQSVDKMIQTHVREIAMELNSHSSRIADMREAIPKKSESWPRIR